MKLNPEAQLDWEAGRGLLDVAIYGGRLQDQYDMRALEAILRKIWSQDIFQGKKKLAGILSVPEVARKDLHIIVEQLPDVDAPRDVFGLPENALRAWERSAAEISLTALKSTFYISFILSLTSGLRINILIIISGMSAKSLDRTERKNAKKVEFKLQNDLKNILERHKTILNTNNSSQVPKNPIERFLDDERNLATKLITCVKTDVDNSLITNTKVK